MPSFKSLRHTNSYYDVIIAANAQNANATDGRYGYRGVGESSDAVADNSTESQRGRSAVAALNDNQFDRDVTANNTSHRTPPDTAPSSAATNQDDSEESKSYKRR